MDIPKLAGGGGGGVAQRRGPENAKYYVVENGRRWTWVRGNYTETRTDGRARASDK